MRFTPFHLFLPFVSTILSLNTTETAHVEMRQTATLSPSPISGSCCGSVESDLGVRDDLTICLYVLFALLVILSRQKKGGGGNRTEELDKRGWPQSLKPLYEYG
ncbi:hypothetical protein J3F84DRAFT_376612 [Trichoderma pleuroticola]